jgi:hypothetical protein
MSVTFSSAGERARADRRFRLIALSPSRLARRPVPESALRALAVLALASSLGVPRSSLAQTLRTDCVSATVVGLRWDVPRRAPTSVTYEIRRDGVLLESTRDTAFVDTEVGPSSAYEYSVATISRRGDPSAPPTQTIQVSTPAARAQGDAPYCPSRAIRSIEFDWQGYTEPNGSDLWPVTWGRDGKVYTFFGDGGGFGGDNDRGRASFGIASMAGTAPSKPGKSTPIAPLARRNVYGGFEAEHPSTLSGKAGAIIAVGRDFYALGGIWNAVELGPERAPLWGSPDREQIVFSRGDAHSWQVGDRTFCSEQDRNGVDDRGHFCPVAFVSYGRGNAGAPDRRVYLVGVSLASWLGSAQTSVADTFLARVKPQEILEANAYEYFGGLDARGKPIWESDTARMRPIFSDRSSSGPQCVGACPPMHVILGEIVYDRAIRRYIGVAQGRFVGQTSFYDAPEPWGPWTVIEYHNVDPASGSGGWANLGTQGGESLGVHIVNAWTSPDGLTLRMTYSSNGNAPHGALFPPEGTALDSFNLVSARLIPNTRSDPPP